MLHSIIVADIVQSNKKNIKTFDKDEKFFHFLSDIQNSNEVEITGISRYYIGGKIIPQEIVFNKRLILRPLPVEDEPKNEDIFNV